MHSKDTVMLGLVLNDFKAISGLRIVVGKLIKGSIWLDQFRDGKLLQLYG
jgi:hypothetical protein